MFDAAGPPCLPTGAEGRQPGEPASVGGKGNLVKSAEGIGVQIQAKKMGKFASFLQAGITAVKVIGKRFGEDLQGLRGGQDDTPVVAMIPQIIGDGDSQGDFHTSNGPGKAFHSCTVLGSMATGTPLAVKAQCWVNPRQISTPVSAWVMM